MRYFTSGNWTTTSKLGLAYTAPAGARLAAIVTNHLGNVKGIYEWPDSAPAPENMIEDSYFPVCYSRGQAAMERHYGAIQIIADPGETKRGYDGYIRVG